MPPDASKNGPVDIGGSWRAMSLPARRGLPPGQRVYAVGDIHGRADLLAEMLSLIGAHRAAAAPRDATVVFLGDYIDRGPASRQVVDRLISLRAEQRTICLMGNHESEMLRFLAGESEHWPSFGGATLRSYGVEPSDFHGRGAAEGIRAALLAALPPAHREFFLSLQRIAVIGDFFFCHAGVRPGVPLDEQDQEDLVWIRDEFLASRADFGKTIVHGHTPVQEPECRPNRIGIDTGACFTGRLTCTVIEAGEISFLQTGCR